MNHNVYCVVSLAGVVSTLLWHTGMPYMSLVETMGEYFVVCCLDVCLKTKICFDFFQEEHA